MSKGENFPVGSLLIRRDLRGVVKTFYRVARATDDIADHPSLSQDEKLRQLDAYDAGLAGDRGGPAEALALAWVGRPEPARHASQLLRAFRRDARNEACGTWDDLLAYCEDSANPVGRFLLDLHGESRSAWPASDALCTALQVLNHLQDLRADHLELGRQYIPLRWMEEEGAPLEDLAAHVMSPALRRVVDRTLDRCDAMLDQADGLPGLIVSRRLAAEAATIVQLARRLSARLRGGDPLARRIKLSRLDFVQAALAGLTVALRPRLTPRAALGKEGA